MSAFVLDDQTYDFFGTGAAPEPQPAPVPLLQPRTSWEPPAMRDPSHDAALFGYQADDLSSHEIPGLNDGFAEMRRMEETFRVALAARSAGKVANDPELDAFGACIERHEDLAKRRCAMGYAHAGRRPTGMTDEDCLADYRDSFAGGNDVFAHTDLANTTRNNAEGGKQVLEGGGTVLGLGVKATGEANQLLSIGNGNGSSDTITHVRNLASRRGYVEACNDELLAAPGTVRP